MQKSEFLKALSDMWKDFDSRVLRYKVCVSRLSSYNVVSVALIRTSSVNFHFYISFTIFTKYCFIFCKQVISIYVTQSRLEDVQHGYVSKCWTHQVFTKICIFLVFFSFCSVLSFNYVLFLI